MGDRISMSISVDSSSDETLNRGPMALLLRRQYEFPSGINIGLVQFSFSILFSLDKEASFSESTKTLPSVSEREQQQEAFKERRHLS